MYSVFHGKCGNLLRCVRILWFTKFAYTSRKVVSGIDRVCVYAHTHACVSVYRGRGRLMGEEIERSGLLVHFPNTLNNKDFTRLKSENWKAKLKLISHLDGRSRWLLPRMHINKNPDYRQIRWGLDLTLWYRLCRHLKLCFNHYAKCTSSIFFFFCSFTSFYSSFFAKYIPLFLGNSSPLPVSEKAISYKAMHQTHAGSEKACHTHTFSSLTSDLLAATLSAGNSGWAMTCNLSRATLGLMNTFKHRKFLFS